MIKQTIVIRRDLKMRRGKEVAQGAHASMAWLTKRLADSWSQENRAPLHFSSDEMEWMLGPFTKICLQTDSEAELKSIYDKAVALGVTASLIVDSGKTEFGGVPTATACAIGPAKAEAVDALTGHLKLY